MFVSPKNKNRQAFGAGGFGWSLRLCLAGPVRQRRVEIKEEKEEAGPQRHGRIQARL
jgi:hypothetical protein